MKLAAAFCLVACAIAQAQSPTFLKLPPGPQAPQPRYDGALAADPAARAIYMFGGQGSAVYNDLWRYSLDSQAWTPIATSGPSPAPRFGHTLVFDSVRRRLILFAGQAGTFYSDVWAFDIAAGSWTQLSPDDAGPLRRYGHGAIYDAAHDRLVITHGFTDQGRFDDTWSFDLKTNLWKDISPANRPLKRCLFHAAYDAAHSQMLIFGGCASGFGPCPLDDLWAFDLNAGVWSQKASAPPARDHYGLSFDSNRSRLVVFEGAGANGLLDDAWEFDPAANAWSQPAIAGATGGARQRMGAIYVAEENATYFFGGQTSAGLSNDLWRLGIVPVDRPALSAALDAFSNAGDAVAPGELVAIYGTDLGRAAGTATSFDAASGKLPTGVDGVSVAVNGIAAPLYFVGAGQINFQAPYEVTPPGPARIAVTTVGGTSASLTLPVAATHPGLAPVVFNQDLTLNGSANPAAQGSVIVLFATGQGSTSPASVTGAYPRDTYPPPALPLTLTVAGKPAVVLFSGQAPLTAGVMQINARLPGGLAAGLQPVVLQVGDNATRQTIGVWLAP